MTWSTVKEAVRLAIATAAGLTDTTGADDGATTQLTAWANKRTANRFLEPAPRWIDLKASAVRAIGQDEVRYDTVTGATPALTTVTPAYCGYRVFSVMAHVGGASQEDTEDAFFLAGKIRLRLRRLDVLAVLQAAGVALVDIGQSLEVDYRNINGRMKSAALIELTFAFTEYEVDASSLGDYVATLSDLDGTIENIDGTDVALSDLTVP